MACALYLNKVFLKKKKLNSSVVLESNSDHILQTSLSCPQAISEMQIPLF